MTIAHNLGFPRIGINRGLKWALERYWKKEINQQTLEDECRHLRLTHWNKQIEAGHDFLSVGDFSLYDHVLDMSTLLGVIPERFSSNQAYDLDTYFRMARGQSSQGVDVHASEMTKWFDTNYHYIVPEFHAKQSFSVTSQKLFSEIEEAKVLGKPIKPILLGPLSYLWLGKMKEADTDKLTLLPNLCKVYSQILTKLRDQGIEWVQIDEPILVLNLPDAWKTAFEKTYAELHVEKLKLLLTTYFGGLKDNKVLALGLKTAGLHIDGVRGEDQLTDICNALPHDKILSVGIVNGRNIWRTDLRKALETLKPLSEKLSDRLWVGSSCSLLHSPVDLSEETNLDPEVKSWLAFATQKLDEISLVAKGLSQGEKVIHDALVTSDQVVQSRKQSPRIHNPAVKKRCEHITDDMTQRQNPYPKRKSIQNELYHLPFLPTTTIGSFPQTQDIRAARQQYKQGKLDENTYREEMHKHIQMAIQKQVELDLDVLVHGEAERNDMVEYFGELLEGFAFTKNGWVQSYGSRCVKPPIIYGDVSRMKPMTTEWLSYAQSLTDRPVKGMLTGPVTILCWSFVRNDQTRFETTKQIALALRDEVNDLVKAGIHIIQIDEPAFREGLPLREEDWETYLKQAVFSFRLASSGIPDSVQIHTHMCYSEFNDTIEAIAALDADVITIETSRSDMELLDAFEHFNYPNDIGPGVYDIHSPRIPTIDEMVHLIEKAKQFIPMQQLWINPDCGLKTRNWSETELALKNMVIAAKQLRKKYESEMVE